MFKSNVIFSSMILEEKIYRTERKRWKAVVFLFLCFFFCVSPMMRDFYKNKVKISIFNLKEYYIIYKKNDCFVISSFFSLVLPWYFITIVPKRIKYTRFKLKKKEKKIAKIQFMDAINILW